MTSPPQDASANVPAPPPEAVLIRLVREASGVKIPDAAKQVGVSKARWSQVELGYEKRLGTPRPVRGSASAVAHMAFALGIPAERLETEGERPDASAVLREMERGRAPGVTTAPGSRIESEPAAGGDPWEDLTEDEFDALLERWMEVRRARREHAGRLRRDSA